MRRVAVPAVTWLAAAVVALGLAWTAVRAVVRAEQADIRAAAALRPGDRSATRAAVAPDAAAAPPVADPGAVGAGTPDAGTGPAAGPAPGTPDAGDQGEALAGPATTAPHAPAPAVGAPPVTTPPNRPAGAPTTTTSLRPRVTTTTSTTSPAGATGGRATYVTEGGSVTVHCTGSASIALDSATPADGWHVEVANRGPEAVEVHLEGGEDEVEVHAACSGGQPVRTG